MSSREDPERVPAEMRSGIDVLHDPALNKSTAFTEEERQALNLKGLLPPRVATMETQLTRVLGNLRRKTSDLEKYIFLIALQDRNERLFYRTVAEHIDEMLPIIYTPTVGEASQEFAHIFRRPRGLYITTKDRGRVSGILRNWPHRDVRVIVVTDGERILGLGDLGANGMGISVGKLSLYVACGGIHPSATLPVTLDVGTDNEKLLDDPLYLGLPQRRVRGQEYDDLVEEFVTAVQEVFPRALIQFEDFITANACRLLRKYRDRALTFNDDIQGTAAVVLAGLSTATRITGRGLADQTILFLGAGSANTGIADLVVPAMTLEGLSVEEARARLWFVNTGGLVVKSREDLKEAVRPYAQDHELLDFRAAVSAIKPTALIGATGRPDMFTRPIIEAMAEMNERPIIFALSNPTSKSEVTAEHAYRWTGGRAVFASGSPFDPVDLDGKTYAPGQSNNAYIFPGVGLGVVASEATRVTEEMFLAAARVLAESVSEESLARGTIYPPLGQIREVSVAIAEAVARVAYEGGLTRSPLPDDLEAHIRSQVYPLEYESIV